LAAAYAENGAFSNAKMWQEIVIRTRYRKLIAEFSTKGKIRGSGETYVGLMLRMPVNIDPAFAPLFSRSQKLPVRRCLDRLLLYSDGKPYRDNE
jgi:hypothetical protein